MENKLINSAIGRENEVIGDLKTDLVKSSSKSQRTVKVSIAEMLGRISLAYQRGRAIGRSDATEEIIGKLIGNYPEAVKTLISNEKQ